MSARKKKIPIAGGSTVTKKRSNDANAGPVATARKRDTPNELANTSYVWKPPKGHHAPHTFDSTCAPDSR